MEFKRLTVDNLETEHICCSLTDKKGESGVAEKKAWLRERMKEGLVFQKADVRGKVFIEYLPAEYAWCPIEADGYFYIDCFWVAGQYQGKGYGAELLKRCIADAKAQGKEGLLCLSSPKKKSYLSDPKYLKSKGFQVADTAEPYFELLYLPLKKGAKKPKFKDIARNGRMDIPENAAAPSGFDLYYTVQCPFTSRYVPVLLQMMEKRGLECRFHKLESCEDAKNAPCPFTTYALFYQGQFVTHEIVSEKGFEKLCENISAAGG